MTNQDSTLQPRVSYSHTLSELSVNRKDPCEVIRELISNSYDAKAKHIKIYPLMQYEGFIFFDDGEGVGTERNNHNISPWEAFFSIGYTTKTRGASIGYKCQGSKLCFASTKFCLISRSSSDVDWNYFEIDNPKNNLSLGQNITPTKTKTPWASLRTLLSSPSPDAQTEKILENLDQSFFELSFAKQGTMIVVLQFEVDNFSWYFNTDSETTSYLYNYIRFNTKHGDIKIIDTKGVGFDSVAVRHFEQPIKDVKKLALEIWKPSEFLSSPGGELISIPSGYPYLQKTLGADGPETVSNLDYARFSDRFARVKKIGGKFYYFVFAIDGWRRAKEGYESLNRQGGRRSGIKLQDHRGSFLCCQGIKICPFDIFSRVDPRYAHLGDSKAQRHFLFFIDGDFELVTNRNSLAASADKLIDSQEFLSSVNDFLDDFYSRSSIFKGLVGRLAGSIEASKLQVVADRLQEFKKNLVKREKFKISGIEPLENQWIIAPIPGEEHGLGLLYGLLSYLVPIDSPYRKFWLRPNTFSGIGIDSLAISLESPLIGEDDIKSLEYKYSFEETYNHPLILTNMILCWNTEIHSEGRTVEDDFNYTGRIKHDDSLEDFGYKITDIQDSQGADFPGEVLVISLKQLIPKTFAVKHWDEALILNFSDSPKNRTSRKKTSKKSK